MFVLANKERIRVSSMKNKIGDLTLKEVQQICNSRPLGFAQGQCGTCPLNDLCQCSFNYDDEDLDQEIEVEEDE